MQTLWDYRYAQRTERMKSSAIRELLKLTERPDIISFAGGLPAPDVFPYQEFQDACNRVMKNNGPAALQYGTTEGYLPLREMIARHSSQYMPEVTANNILITSGSQQALDFIGRLFINRGDYIVVESPTYLGALQAWNAYGAQYITVRCDEDGMVVDELESALRIGPKFIYVLPNFQNPGGFTLSLRRRQQLINLADRYGVPIIEDDPYGQLRYDGENIPSLVSLDGEFRGKNGGCYSGNVIYLSTFSKLLAAAQAEGEAARVLEVRQDVDKLGADAESGFELVDHHAVFIATDCDVLGAVGIPGLEGAEISGGFDDDVVAAVDEQPSDKIESLL